MSKLKVLRDQPYCREGLIFSDLLLEELEEFQVRKEPIIGVNGWYYDRKENVTWYECFGSSWWRKTQKERDKDVEQFQYELDLLSYKERPLTREQRRGLAALSMRSGQFRKPARDLLYMAQCADMSINIRREAVKSRRRMMGV